MIVIKKEKLNDRREYLQTSLANHDVDANKQHYCKTTTEDKNDQAIRILAKVNHGS